MTAPINLAASLRRLVSTNMPVGRIAVGVDAVDVARLRRQLAGSAGPSFLAKTFTDTEIADCRGMPERFASRWAAKEAVAKAIGTGFRGLRPKMIEVVKARTGEPSVRPVNSDAWPRDAHLWAWEISMAHDGDVAIAIALALTEPR